MTSERERLRRFAEIERARAEAAARRPLDYYPPIENRMSEDALLRGRVERLRTPDQDESGLAYGEPISDGRGAVRKGHR